MYDKTKHKRLLPNCTNEARRGETMWFSQGLHAATVRSMYDKPQIRESYKNAQMKHRAAQTRETVKSDYRCGQNSGYIFHLPRPSNVWCTALALVTLYIEGGGKGGGA